MTRHSAQRTGSIAIAGGGTGGHVMPALAVAEALRERGARLFFIGAERGIEKRVVPEAGFALATLPVLPFVGRTAGERLRAVFALIVSTLRAALLLRQRHIRLVIAVGGYACAPAALAARPLGIPLVLINADAAPGRANRLLARLAGRIYVGCADAARYFDRPGRVVVSGTPLRAAFRREFFRDGGKERSDAQRAAGDGRTRLFIFGGSQGAAQLNAAMLCAAPALDPKRVAVVHQSGAAERACMEAGWRAAGFEDARVIDFERDMPGRYRWADLVVCRAGAGTVAELALAGKAALLVPLAHTGGGEQAANARALEAAGAARVLGGADLDQAEFQAVLRELLEDSALRERMGRAAAASAKTDAAVRIAGECLELLGDAT